jgi:hypothetical protein
VSRSLICSWNEKELVSIEGAIEKVKKQKNEQCGNRSWFVGLKEEREVYLENQFWVICYVSLSNIENAGPGENVETRK